MSCNQMKQTHLTNSLRPVLVKFETVTNEFVLIMKYWPEDFMQLFISQSVSHCACKTAYWPQRIWILIDLVNYSWSPSTRTRIMFYVEICHLHRMGCYLIRSCYFVGCIVKQMYQFGLYKKNMEPKARLIFPTTNFNYVNQLYDDLSMTFYSYRWIIWRVCIKYEEMLYLLKW